MDKGASDADIWNLSQGPNDSLKKYITNFKEIMSKLPCVSHTSALSTPRKGFWYESKFQEELIVHKPTTIQDALFQATNWMEVEDGKT